MCWGPQTIPCLLHDWWLSLWELLGIQVIWDCFPSYVVAIPFSFFNPSPNSTLPIPDLMSNGWEKYLHLPQPAACRAFQRMAMLGSCQHIIASVWVSGIETDPNLDRRLDLLFFSYFPIFVPTLLLDRINLGSEILTVKLVTLSFHLRSLLSTGGGLLEFPLPSVGHFG